MLRDDLRTLWTEPRPPDAPGRVWRDWALLAAGLGGVVLEATLRQDVVWRPVAVVFAVWLCVLPMWRRTLWVPKISSKPVTWPFAPQSDQLLGVV